MVAALALEKAPLCISPLIHPDAKAWLQKTEKLFELKQSYDEPLHLIFPHIFRHTLTSYQDLLSSLNIDFQILYAKKANKAHAFVQECARAGAGVDCASVGELMDSIRAGVLPEHIGISGPAKSKRLLVLATQLGCLVALDSLDELEHAAQIARAVGKPLRILLRLRPESQQSSRFGFSEAEFSIACERLETLPVFLMLEGLSFHLSGYDLQERAAFALEVANRIVKMQHRFPHCHTLNIGGGLPISYVSEPVWNEFLRGNSEDNFHANRRFDDFYPYYSPVSGVEALSVILTQGQGEGSLRDFLHQHGLTILLEPGRALLDQAGMTLFSVQGLKDRGNYSIATVDGTSFSVSEQWFGSEFLPDPILITPIKRDGDSCQACIGGVSCLDSDMLTWRKVLFPQRPKVGDLVCYMNTAGYQMDSNESEFHNLPLPEKLCLFSTGVFDTWCRDSTYLAILDEDNVNGL